MGKPMGNYLTLEAPGMASPDEDYHREISEALAYYLKELMGEERERSILVAGLGCLLYTSPSPRDVLQSRMPSSA